MSLKPWLLTLCALSILGTLTGLAGAALMSPPIARESVALTKARRFLPDSLRLAKPNQAIEVAIEPVDGFAQTNQETTHLRAVLTARRAADAGYAYHWELPEGAVIVQGDAGGTLDDLQVDQETSLDVVLTGFSSEGDVRNVRLVVSGVDHGATVAATAIFSSHPTRSDLSRGYRESKSGFSPDPAAPAQSKPRLPANVHL